MSSTEDAPAAPRPADQRVVVTGFGVISNIGTGREEFLAGLREGRCGTGPITGFDTTGFDYAYGGETPDVDPTVYLQRLKAEESGRVSAHAAATARMAMEHAGFDPEIAQSERGLIAIGTTCGESLDVDALAAAEIDGELSSVHAGLARRVQPGRLSVTVAQELGLSDVEAVTIPTVCAAGNYAVGYGLDAIRMGEADFAVCGGADAVSRMAFAGFYRLRALAPGRCKPFDLNRDGFLFSEGAGMLILESLEHARARGATILGEIAGLGLNCDAQHPTKPSQLRVEECVRRAVADAATTPDEVDLVFAHGTGTKINDPMEARAFREVFGDTPVTALKSMIGHTAGAAGAHACIAALLGMENDFIPPTINFSTPDPECPVDCVPNEARAARLGAVVVNSLGVGGNNAAVLLRRWEA